MQLRNGWRWRLKPCACPGDDLEVGKGDAVASVQGVMAAAADDELFFIEHFVGKTVVLLPWGKDSEVEFFFNQGLLQIPRRIFVQNHLDVGVGMTVGLEQADDGGLAAECCQADVEHATREIAQ